MTAQLTILLHFIFWYRNKIKLVKTPKNSKVAYSTNLGFTYSSGQYIALLGDDDYWNDDLKLYKQLQLFDKSKNTAIVGSYWFELGNTRKVCKTHPIKFK